MTAVAFEMKVRVCLVLLFFAPGVLSDDIDLPPVACPHYFRYQTHGNGYVGKITLDDVPFSTLNLEVTFSQKESIRMNFRGRLAFEHNLIKVQKDFEAGNPITFIVNFPLATEIPKLIGIKMNGKDICTASAAKDQEVIYSMKRSFTPTQGTHRISKATISVATTIAEEPFLETADSALCGISSFSEANEQYNATWGWFPWATKIYRRNSFDYGLSLIASGVLISSRTVITVLSSFRATNTADELLVHLGVLGLVYNTSAYPVIRHVKTLLRHPEYGMNTYSDADIALLQLDQPVIFNKYVLPICLWDEPKETDRIVGKIGYIAFFSHSGLDRVINGTIISQSQCLQSFPNYATTISSRTLCIDYHLTRGPTSANQGGSAIIMYRNGRWTLRGVYSSCIVLYGTCLETLYFVYSDIAKFGTWISDNMIL